ncbi:LacI family DNA-binding transcriptional regulator [Clostridium thermarum]|uniref:LacI family DNA-binding transcriptional regulator n=1 Tax=Clostridium thermarum TaxID=1716543 RepID=UPI0013D13F9C|nr:LacI family DNA-binding transcriptional regulator [Clostridium thermarum]
MSDKQKVTIKDVAKEAGVSIATVSYVINNIDKVTDETKEKVNAAIEKLKYEPNIIARSLVKKESRVIAVLLPVHEDDKKSALTENPFYQEFINGAEYRSRESNYIIQIVGAGNEERTAQLLKSGSIAGIIALGFLPHTSIRILSNLSVPVVMVDQPKSSYKFIYVSSENEKGSFLATEYLIKQGHRKIGLLTGSTWGHIYTLRFNGYKSALEKYGIEFNENYIFECPIVDYDNGTLAADKVKDKVGEITAIFSTADVLALGLIKGLYHQNITVPKDLSVIGFDNISNSKYFIPELTTASQNIFHKGEKAADIVINGVNGLESFKKGQNEYILPIEIVERESVRKLE